MRNSRRKKTLDLRRAHLGGDSPSLYALYAHLFPEDSRHKKSFWFDREEWDRRWNHETDWIREKTGIGYYVRGCGNAPAWFRRGHNRLRRAREKAAICNAFRDDDWDDFSLPRVRRDINWLWW